MRPPVRCAGHGNLRRANLRLIATAAHCHRASGRCDAAVGCEMQHRSETESDRQAVVPVVESAARPREATRGSGALLARLFQRRPKDRRASPRRVVQLSAVIVTNDFKGAIHCRVQNLSQGGAGLRVPECLVLPSTFWLIVVPEGQAYAATTAWRRFPNVGVSLGEPVDLHEATTTAARTLRTLWLAVAK
ncbi:MAG: PilZ domain-containing protein [Caulobacterales bacterium]